MKELWFISVETFGPSNEGWEKYIQWSKLTQLKEVVGLDCSLCPAVIRELSEEDWDHVVAENFLICYFRDREYLTSRTRDVADKHILGVVLEPDTDERSRIVKDGEFLGYDLIERQTSISALTNCQGFPESFDNQELNEFGLLSEYLRARQIQHALSTNNPEEPHANTDLWAIWKLQDSVVS